MTREVRAATAAICFLLAIVAGQQVYIATRPVPVKFLDYPLQRVMSSAPGVRGPAVRVGDDLEVQGVKCNSGPAPLKVSGATTWVSVVPRGSVIEVARGQATRLRGCQAFTFRNPIPAPVAARAARIAADLRVRCTTWQVTGREVPDDPMVLPETWQSEPFQVCVT